MAWSISPCRASVLAVVWVVALATGSAIAQPPAPTPGPGSAELNLTPAEEKDSYEIYSILLRKEMPPQWNIAAWAISQETRTFPSDGPPNGRGPGACLQPPVHQ